MPKLTQPGIPDLHWQVTVCSPNAPPNVGFYETEEDAKMIATAALDTPLNTVYVAQVMHHGEHRRARKSGRG